MQRFLAKVFGSIGLCLTLGPAAMACPDLAGSYLCINRDVNGEISRETWNVEQSEGDESTQFTITVNDSSVEFLTADGLPRPGHIVKNSWREEQVWCEGDRLVRDFVKWRLSNDQYVAVEHRRTIAQRNPNSGLGIIRVGLFSGDNSGSKNRYPPQTDCMRLSRVPIITIHD